MITANLLSEEIRVVTPFIKITFGEQEDGFTFGIYSAKPSVSQDAINGAYKIQNIRYPNYIQGIQIEKINGQVNNYTIDLKYGINENLDPNFFEKIFSKISSSRKIILSYGDLNAPAFVYKNEEALITNINKNIDISNSSISYTINAVSSSKLAGVGAFNFKEEPMAQPSDIIKKLLLNNDKYGLQDIFTGMRNMDLVLSNKLIADDDIAVYLKTQRNMSILEYLNFLVKSMQSSTNNKDIYVFKVVDDVGSTNVFGGPYFKVVNGTTAGSNIDCYSLDIGFDYKTNNAVTSFTITNQEQYSIFYNYSEKLTPNEYVQRIDDLGNTTNIYAPVISSKNDQGITFAEDYNWWKNVTQYPLSIQLQVRGLLRPAILMSKVDLAVIWLGGHLGIETGSYIITKQVDNIGMQGYFTTLNLVRVGNSERYPNPSTLNFSSTY